MDSKISYQFCTIAQFAGTVEYTLDLSRGLMSHKTQLSRFCIYPTPLHKQDEKQGKFLSSLGRIEFSFSWLVFIFQVNELPYYLFIATERIVGCISFPNLFALWTANSPIQELNELYIAHLVWLLSYPWICPCEMSMEPRIDSIQE